MSYLCARVFVCVWGVGVRVGACVGARVCVCVCVCVCVPSSLFLSEGLLDDLSQLATLHQVMCVCVCLLVCVGVGVSVCLYLSPMFSE